jgi:adenosine deaminase
LLEYLRLNEIHLEVCPTCNIQTNIFDGYINHPVNFLYESGLSVGINTDGRTLANVSLSEEYKKLVDTFDWGIDHFLKCNLNAISKAFLSESDKKQLAQKIVDGYSNQ